MNPALPAGRLPPPYAPLRSLGDGPASARRTSVPASLASHGPGREPPRPHTPQERIGDEGAERLSTPDLLEVLLDGAATAPPAPVLRPSGLRAAAGWGPSVADPVRPAAREAWAVLDRFESLRRVATGTVAELRAAGVTAGGAARLAAAFALGRRAASEPLPKGAPFRTSADIFERYHPVLRDARRERFVAILLDGKNRVMRDEIVSEGSLTSSLVHPREVFALAIRESAGAMVFVHNHPSGDPEPSPEDIDITRRLCSVGEVVGIRILDHVVVGEGAYVSFLDRGWIG